MDTDRYFGAAILFGRLHIGSVSDRTWDVGRLHFFHRSEVDPGVVDECGDRIVETHEELKEVRHGLAHYANTADMDSRAVAR